MLGHVLTADDDINGVVEIGRCKNRFDSGPELRGHNRRADPALMQLSQHGCGLRIERSQRNHDSVGVFDEQPAKRLYRGRILPTGEGDEQRGERQSDSPAHGLKISRVEREPP